MGLKVWQYRRNDEPRPGEHLANVADGISVSLSLDHNEIRELVQIEVCEVFGWEEYIYSFDSAIAMLSATSRSETIDI